MTVTTPFRRVVIHSLIAAAIAAGIGASIAMSLGLPRTVAGITLLLFLAVFMGTFALHVFFVTDQPLIDRAARGVPDLVNGQRVAVSGALEAIGPLVTSPISGQPCAMFMLARNTDDSAMSSLAYFGEQSAGLAVRWGGRRVKISGKPEIRSGFEGRQLSGRVEAEKLLPFVYPLADVLPWIDEYFEIVIQPGHPVCVVGHYSSLENAIRDGGDENFYIVGGGAANAGRGEWSNRLTGLIFGLICFAAAIITSHHFIRKDLQLAAAPAQAPQRKNRAPSTDPAPVPVYSPMARNVCEMITADELKPATGIEGVGQPRASAEGDMCTWFDPSGKIVVVMVLLSQWMFEASRTEYESLYKTNAKDITGVGDKAFMISGTDDDASNVVLIVLKGSTPVAVHIMNSPDTASSAREVMALAEIVLKKL